MMTTRLRIVIVGLVIGFAVPTFAQDQKTVDPEVREQIEAAYAKYAEVFNKHDETAMGDLYTQDAVEVWPAQSDGGLMSGRQAIAKAVIAESVSGFHLEHKIVQIYECGNDICAITEWGQGMHSGRYSVVIYVRDADDWKIRMKNTN
jgi:ketosteroid isomerase-like protein